MTDPDLVIDVSGAQDPAHPLPDFYGGRPIKAGIVQTTDNNRWPAHAANILAKGWALGTYIWAHDDRDPLAEAKAAVDRHRQAKATGLIWIDTERSNTTPATPAWVAKLVPEIRRLGEDCGDYRGIGSPVAAVAESLGLPWWVAGATPDYNADSPAIPDLSTMPAGGELWQFAGNCLIGGIHYDLSAASPETVAALFHSTTGDDFLMALSDAEQKQLVADVGYVKEQVQAMQQAWGPLIGQIDDVKADTGATKLLAINIDTHTKPAGD